MFTIRIRRANGDESTHACHRLEFIAEAQELAEHGSRLEPGVVVHYEGGSLTHFPLADRNQNIQFWLMNGQGATVAHYHI